MPKAKRSYQDIKRDVRAFERRVENKYREMAERTCKDCLGDGVILRVEVNPITMVANQETYQLVECACCKEKANRGVVG